MKDRKRYWYHCSEIFHGEEWIATRKHRLRIKSDKEPDTPRLCVCSTVAACFAARMFLNEVYIYRTKFPRRGISPRGVWDKEITGERWLIPPVELILIDTISKEVVDKCFVASKLYYETTKKKSNVRLRIAQYARCIEVLGNRYTSKREMRYLGRVMNSLNISVDCDLDMFILNL